MYRIETGLLLLALLPLIAAAVFRAAVLPERKRSVLATLTASEQSKDPDAQDDGKEYALLGKARVSREFESLYNSRLFIPAAILSLLYVIGLSLGLQMIVAKQGFSCPVFLCGTLICIKPEHLLNPTSALLGCYVFNSGVLVRRSFVADITKTVFWSSVNRAIFTVGISIAIAASPLHASPVLCFAIAFFPRIAITWLRKAVTGQLSNSSSTVEELDLQLVQGIDVWKEERLEEEGIESVQNLSTADALSLAVKTRYPLRTILDWIDQAILIQRYPALFRKMQEIGLATSAVELCLMSRVGNEQVRASAAEKLGLDLVIFEYELKAMYEDAAIQNIWHLWQTRDVED